MESTRRTVVVEERGQNRVRIRRQGLGQYALPFDDIAVFVASERAAERVLERLTRWLHTHLDLEVNAAKSGARRTEETALLGFRIHPGGQVSPAPKAIERFKDRVRVEASDLALKLKKLGAFIETDMVGIPPVDQQSLKDQYKAMSEYLDILKARISRFYPLE